MINYNAHYINNINGIHTNESNDKIMQAKIFKKIAKGRHINVKKIPTKRNLNI